MLNSKDEVFLSFLCEMLHPVVRHDAAEVEKLHRLFNQALTTDGWEIVSKTYIADRPVFAARRRILEGNITSEPLKSLAKTLNSEYIMQQITRMESSIEPDPELAIGTAKEFIETICKTVLYEYGKPLSGREDLPKLVKMVREKLDLLPDNVHEKTKGADTIKRVLSNLGTVAQGLAELRGLYGSGHGKSARASGLKARHARLAVGSASTLGVFIYETYLVRKGDS